MVLGEGTLQGTLDDGDSFPGRPAHCLEGYGVICAVDSWSPTSSRVSASRSPVPVAPGTTIVDVGQTSLGSVLVDKAGRTLYLFLADKGTSARTDGTTMVTYNGHPLYYFIGDKKAGDVSGQGVNGFGALWFVVSPSGTQIG